MTDNRPPPPEPEDCLAESRASRYKGGALITEDVHDLPTHRRRPMDPDGYRPDGCMHCARRSSWPSTAATTSARALLDAKASVEAADSDGNTPLAWTAVKGNAAMSVELIGRGA